MEASNLIKSTKVTALQQVSGGQNCKLEGVWVLSG